nr:hypothetical protein [Haliscomenobacter sp.]
MNKNNKNCPMGKSTGTAKPNANTSMIAPQAKKKREDKKVDFTRKRLNKLRNDFTTFFQKNKAHLEVLSTPLKNLPLHFNCKA